MSYIRITKKFNFEMAHALKDYDGLCAHLHGHSYILNVTIIGIPLHQNGHTKNGMVMDFADLKNIVQQEIIDHCDHALMLHEAEKDKIVFSEDSALHRRIIFVDYQPTSENILIDFAQRIGKRLPQNVKLHHLELNETATSSAAWWADDQA
jgi:6-pyruvoyltetrahydropterin/6-carboxytetrahydropterin synthase